MRPDISRQEAAQRRQVSAHSFMPSASQLFAHASQMSAQAAQTEARCGERIIISSAAVRQIGTACLQPRMPTRHASELAPRVLAETSA